MNNNNNNYMNIEDLLEQMRKYETLYEKVEEFGLENELHENRYGRTNDEIITKNLLILCVKREILMVLEMSILLIID